METIEQNISLEKWPALVLNADYRPLSYYPLSLCSWQDSIKAVFLQRVSVIENYPDGKNINLSGNVTGIGLAINFWKIWIHFFKNLNFLSKNCITI